MSGISAKTASEISAKMRELTKLMKQQIEQALTEEAEAIVKRAKEEFVPVDSGKLRDSIQVVSGVEQGRSEKGQFTSSADISVAVSAGGQDVPHAVVVHETPSGFDPPTWEGKEIKFTRGGPKYLERPLLEAENGMVNRIAAKVKLS
jgi:hypothetical protein